MKIKDNLKLSSLTRVKLLASQDSQINTSGQFTNFTDFQHIMFSDMSLIELLWENDEDNLVEKTIEQLYIEHFNQDENPEIQYETLIFDDKAMLNMSKKDNRIKYRNQVLGKLIRYGFADIKINKKITGKRGFDAFILEDKFGNPMLYFPCTNLVETEDFLYDSYPLIDSLSKKGKKIGNIIKAKQTYDSQQYQAKQLLKKCIQNIPEDRKIIVSGYSLGGSLAEAAYLYNYKQYPEIFETLILFNPYHNRLSKSEIEIIKKSGHLKLYVCEGDSVSTVFNYNDFYDASTPVYIDYNKNALTTIKNIDNGDSLFSDIVNHLKKVYCENIILKCIELKKNKIIFSWPLNIIIKDLNALKEKKVNTIKFLKILNLIFKKLEKINIKLRDKYDLSFLENIQYIEYIFTSTHLTYTIDTYKHISFDQNGKIKKHIKIGNQNHEVTYPSFDKTSSMILGTNIYKDVSQLIKELEKKR